MKLEMTLFDAFCVINYMKGLLGHVPCQDVEFAGQLFTTIINSYVLVVHAIFTEYEQLIRESMYTPESRENIFINIMQYRNWL